MSRGIKDLREIICISRLSIRDSSDDDSSSCVSSDEILSQRDLLDNNDVVNSEAIITTRGISSGSSGDSGCFGESKFSKPLANKFSNKYELQASKSLPPPVLLKSKQQLNDEWRDILTPLPISKNNNLDHLLPYLDTNIITEWLSQANAMIQRLSKWFFSELHFVDFSHFWLSEFPLEQKFNILRLEYGVLMDELLLAFKVGLATKAVQSSDLSVLLKSLLHEYPNKLLNSDVHHLILNYIDILTSGRTDEYRHLLTNVKLSTKNKTYVEWYLSIRSFGLISMINALVDFYQNLIDRKDIVPITKSIPKGYLGEIPDYDKWKKRTILAMTAGTLSTLKYIIAEKKIVPSKFVDYQGRNLLCLAVSLKQESVLQYLLNHSTSLRLDVNAAADNGNRPLHCAVSLDNLASCRLLLELGQGVNINATNHLSGGTSPLHVAVLNGSIDIVQYLLSKGASISQCDDSGMSPLTLAETLEMQNFVDLMKEMDIPHN